MEDLSAFSARSRLAALLDRFAKVEDTRQAWKVMYPLREVFFLVVCGTIASGDDYDDIVDWGEAHLTFLRGFAEFHFGIPCVGEKSNEITAIPALIERLDLVGALVSIEWAAR